MLSLDQLLDGLDVAVEPFAICHVRGARPLDLGRRDEATIHLTLAGRGRMALGRDLVVPVEENTVLIVPPGRRHRLAGAGADPGDPVTAPRCEPIEPGLDRISAGGTAEPGVVLACSALTATYQGLPGLFDYMPDPLVARLDEADPIRQDLCRLLDEQRGARPGARAMCQVLMRRCLILLLRRHCGEDAGGLSWIGALEDPRLGRAVAAIFERPAADHSLERLAETAGMSRSAFAAHFSQVFRRGPMDLVKEVRLRRAARLLRSGDLPIKTLAHSVGYQSRSYFSRAFKELYGQSPAAYRRQGAPDSGEAGSDHPRRGMRAQ